MRILAIFVTTVLFLTRPVCAEIHHDIYAALHMDEVVAVMRQEGLDEAEATAEIYLKNSVRNNFDGAVDALYAEASIKGQLLNGLRAALSESDAELALEFYRTPLGMLVGKLETTGRVAISNDAVEEMAISIAQKALQAKDERAELLQSAADEMGLTEYNLSGAFAARYAFLSGLSEADELGISQDQIIELIAADEDSLRAEIDQWVLGFVFMAYRPLSDTELSDYLAFQMSSIGKALNQALFESFNAVSIPNAGQLGKLLATALQARDL